MLKGRKVVVGVTGGIAAYKTCTIVSRLVQKGAEVDVIMTKNATEFVSPLTFESLSGRPVVTDMFRRDKPWEIEHVSLAQKAELIVIAPATANMIGKIAGGICDDMLSTTVMATRAPLMLAPAMNTGMYENPIFMSNLKKLEAAGAIIVDSRTGHLACGDEGKGRMAEPEEIISRIEEFFEERKKDYEGLKVLVTAGATSQPIDGVRFLTNRSSGKMGLAIAAQAKKRGAEVLVILGEHKAQPPAGVKVIGVRTTSEMYRAVMDNFEQYDIIVKAAAPCDYKPIEYSNEKIKGDRVTLHLEKNEDIAKAVGKNKGSRALVVFSAETNDLQKNAMKKLSDKNADIIVANDVTKEGAGFDTDTNIVTLMDRSGTILETGKLPKSEIADIILDKILQIRNEKRV